MPRGAPLTVVTTDRSTHTGRLLHIDDEGLVLSAGSSPRNAPPNLDAIRYVPAPRIGYITTQQPFLQRLFAEQLFIPAGNPEQFKQHAVETLHDHARYRRAIPPELRGHLQQISSSGAYPTGTTPNASTVRSVFRQRMTKQIRVTLASGFNLLHNEGSYSVLLNFFDQSLGAQAVNYTFPLYALKADLRMANRIRVGAMITWMRTRPILPLRLGRIRG